MISPLNLNILNMYVAPEYLGAIKDERINQKHLPSSADIYTVDKKQSGWLDILTVLINMLNSMKPHLCKNYIHMHGVNI